MSYLANLTQKNLLMNVTDFLSKGFSVIPIKAGEKFPSISWKDFQTRPMTEQEARKNFKKGSHVGLVCGVNGVECLDIDLKNDTTGELYINILTEVPKAIFKKVVIVETRNKGYHWWYQIEGDVPASHDLAKCAEGKVLIETRGTGGQALIPPSAGYTLKQKTFEELQYLTQKQHEQLMNIMRGFNDFNEVKPEPKKAKAAPTQISGEELTPWDDFNSKHTPLEVLESHGWNVHRNTPKGYEISKPGKTPTGKDGIVTDNIAHIHSTSTILPVNQNLTAYAIYTWYMHSGDFSASAKALLEAGYGTAPKPRTKTKKTTKKAEAPEEPKPEPPKENVAGYIEGVFCPLGFDKEDSGVQAFYFYSLTCKSLIRLTASKMTKQNLFTIAPMECWERWFPGKRGFDNFAAADWLISLCNKRGYFSTEQIRGRGAWIDNKKIVLHTGTTLIIDGQECGLGERDTEFIYELGSNLDVSIDDPLSKEQSGELARLLMSLNWESSVYGALLSGWLAIAPLTGVLNWRPHIWITGAKGSGKSWLFDNIVRKMIDNISISVQGNSTEAGLRQTLKNDALNVIFDEAEGETEDAQARIQNVMGLMRAASAHAGAPILKGSKSGTSQTFRIRSCFAFASIVPQIVHDSDKRRVTVLEIAKHKKPEVFKAIEKKRIELLTDDYVRKFQARMILNLDKILESIKIFTDTIAVEIGDRALGDQLGAMLGGWWHCERDEVVSAGEALATVQDLAKELNIGDEETKDLTDEERCLQFLLSAEEFVQGEFTGNASVGELVEVVSSGTYQTRIQHQDADRKLKMLGLKVVEQDGAEYLAILNTSAWVLSRLKGTAWTKSHSQVLSRIPGTIKKQMRFSSGVKGRSILIPINYVL